MKHVIVSLLVVSSTAWTPLAPRRRAVMPLSASSGSSDSSVKRQAPLQRRQLLSAAAAAMAIFTTSRSAQALDLLNVSAMAEATGEALKPEFLKPENQQMVDILAAYRQPLANLRLELSKMKEPQPIEDKSIIFTTVQTFLDPKQKKSLLRELERAAPLMAVTAAGGEQNELERGGPALVADARSAIGALVAATRAGDLTAERQEAAKLSALLEEAFQRLGDFRVPPPAPVGNGKLLGVF